MNDFVIQGVTILGSAKESLVADYVTLVVGSILVIFSIACIIAMIAEKYFCFSAFTILSLALLLCSASIITAKANINKEPDTIYTISIDDTAKYNEIKDAFETITEQKNGLYEVTLKNIE